jgi:hypothetical protein
MSSWSGLHSEVMFCELSKGSKQNTRSGKSKYITIDQHIYIPLALGSVQAKIPHPGSGDDILKARWNAFCRRLTVFKVMVSFKYGRSSIEMRNTI